MEPIRVTETVGVPTEGLAFKAVRAGGPGGQNVNKVSSKVELRVDIQSIYGMPETARDRLRAALANRLDADGWWIVTASRSRDQGRNLEEARDKVRTAILAALEPPVPRRPTRPTRASQTRRLEAKRRAGQRKRERRGED